MEVAEARELARDVLSEVPGTRWAHVQGVGAAAEQLLPAIGEHVAVAAWLHDVGYAPALVDTGFHPVDGARWLRKLQLDPVVVSLVAWHSTAWHEAAERGLTTDLSEFAAPDPDDRDALALVDLTTGPTGHRLTVTDRITEVLSRYPSTHPAHRSMTAARAEMMASATRAWQRFGLPSGGVHDPNAEISSTRTGD